MISISSRSEGSATIVQVSGRIDAETAPGFEQNCLEAVHGAEKLVVLDFGGVQYISSAGLRSLLVVGKGLQERGGVFRLANLTPTVASSSSSPDSTPCLRALSRWKKRL